MDMMLIPLLSGIGLMLWGEQVKEEHPILTLMFQLMFIPLIWITLEMAAISTAISYSSNADLVSVIGDIVYYLGWLFFAIGVYYCFYILGRVRNIIQEKKADKERMKHGEE